MKEAETQYHIQLKPGDIGRYVLLPGDPGRCEKIASFFDNPQFVASNREYCTYSGTLLGEKVAVTSTGIGCPSTAIAVEELIRVGADTFIRIGTAGVVQPGHQTGEVAVVTGAIRDEGTTPQYLPIEYPAIADIDLVCALRDAARDLGYTHYLGVAHSKDSFYGEVEPQRMPLARHLQERWQAWVAGGAVCSEMESAAILMLAQIYRKRAGGVMLLIGNPAEEQNEEELRAFNAMMAENRAIRTAVAGLKLLIARDRQTG